LAIASDSFKDNRVSNAPSATSLNYYLVKVLEDSVSLPTEFTHLKHKRQAFQLSISVKCRQDLILTTHFNGFSWAEA
jgi:hypothetical protein